MGGGGGAPAPQVQRPHWQQQVYTPNTAPMWYNGGPMPENVKTFKDLKPGIKKAWGALTRRRSSSNASSASSASVSTKDGGGGSEGDISSINEEDEEVDTPPSTASGASTSATATQGGKGPQGVALTKEGLLVNQPPGSELNNNMNIPYSTPAQAQENTPYEGGQPLRRKDSDAYSDISSNALSETETDLDSREALMSAHGLSESPSYTPGIGPSGHYFPSHSHHLHGGENHEGVRSGEVTPKRGHSPPSSPGVNNGHERHWPSNKHWTPHVSEHHYQYTNSGGTGSTPGSGANTPRRRMSMGDMSTSFAQPGAGGHDGNKKGMSVFGFDEAQLKNRLGQMDLNSRRRKPSHLDEAQEGQAGEAVSIDENEVPPPVDSRQVRGAGMEVAV